MIIKTGNTKLSAYSNEIRQNYFMSDYYALTGSSVFIEYKNPINQNFTNLKVSGYITNFGDNDLNYFSLPDKPTNHTYTAKGTYYVTYSAIYTNDLVLGYIIPTPFTINDVYPEYNINNLRSNSEIILNLPYSFDEISIQPNEWGVEDIFNTSISRLQDCLDYLTSKTQILNEYAPTMFYGWLGNIVGTPASTLSWYTQSYNKEYLYDAYLSKSKGASFFTNLVDFTEKRDYLYAIDNNNLRIFKNESQPKEIPFTNGDQTSAFLISPIAFDVNDDGSELYIADVSTNFLHKLNISINTQNLSASNINIQLFIGGFGSQTDNYSFNSPTQVSYVNDNVYVLDYGNFCIKEYNKDLNWIYTYYIPEFEYDRIISFAVHSNGLIYVLTKNYNIYVFDHKSNQVFESFSIPDADDDNELIKIIFDSSYNFIYVLTKNNIFKYTTYGVFVTQFAIINNSYLKFINIKSGDEQKLYAITNNAVIKFYDILDVFKLGEGLSNYAWGREQLKVYKNEFSSDLNYNRSLLRITQNVKNFRDNLNAKFIVANENIQNKIITYYSFLPINVKTDQPVFSNDIEKEELGVGVNELHIPPVINKELKKIYDALFILSDFLSIKNYFIKNNDCFGKFCWSWKATSCYNLTLPIIKTCSVNPISYQELFLSQNNQINYSPTTLWYTATSKCCK